MDERHAPAQECADRAARARRRGGDEAQERCLATGAREAGVADAVLFTGWLPTRKAGATWRAAESGSRLPARQACSIGPPTKSSSTSRSAVPVVANDNPDQERILREGGGGLCVPLTAADFAAAVCTLLRRCVVRRAMAVRGPSLRARFARVPRARQARCR